MIINVIMRTISFLIGLVRVVFYDGDEWVWAFTIPEGATASVTLPGETEAKEYTEGTYEVRQNG